MDAKYAIGLDYSSDGARAIVIDGTSGAVLASAEKHYLRWKEGKPNGIFFMLASEMPGHELEMVGDNLAKGICGQIGGADIPDMIGLEASQSVFGNVFAWMRQLLSFPMTHIVMESDLISEEAKAELVAETEAKIILALTEEAERIPPEESSVLATAWMAEAQSADGEAARGTITGITQSTTAPMIFRALVEATAFGTRAIADRMRREGVSVDSVIGIGEIAMKSPFAMQTLADVLGIPIKACSDDAVDAASQIFACSGSCANLGQKLQSIAGACVRDFVPDEIAAEAYTRLYRRYQALASQTMAKD